MRSFLAQPQIFGCFVSKYWNYYLSRKKKNGFENSQFLRKMVYKFDNNSDYFHYKIFHIRECELIKPNTLIAEHIGVHDTCVLTLFPTSHHKWIELKCAKHCIACNPLNGKVYSKKLNTTTTIYSLDSKNYIDFHCHHHMNGLCSDHC